MHIPSMTPDNDKPVSPWIKVNGREEMPPGPPMSLDSPWVKSLQILFPKENPVELSKHAFNLLSNMMRILSNEISRNSKKARETAQRWKDAIRGR